MSPCTITSKLSVGFACASDRSPGATNADPDELSAPATGDENVTNKAASTPANNNAAPREPPPHNPFEREPALRLPPQSALAFEPEICRVLGRMVSTPQPRFGRG